MDVKVRTDQYIFNTYKRHPVILAKARGSWAWDDRGHKYLDFFSGLAVSGIGHNLPSVVAAARTQTKALMHASNLYYTEPAARLAEQLCQRSFAGKVFFCNSGAEANEAAIKLARRHGWRRMQPNPASAAIDRYEIIVFEKSFHGRTLATLAATAQPKFHEGFGPLPEGFVTCRYNDVESVQRAIGPKTTAILIEPIQGEGGIRPARVEFLQELRELANRHDLLLMFDGVQCSLGRTGDLFSYQTLGVTPDVLTLAKGLGGGLPIGAMLAKASLSSLLGPGDHGTTFGGNPVCCAAALAVLKMLSPKMLQNVRRQGDSIMRELHALLEKHPVVKEIRGIGLMIGVELTIPGAPIVDACRAAGLLINCTQTNVLRFLPPLALRESERRFAMGVLRDIFDSLKGDKI
ncbi:MAG TPA: aspartate aminotransferase family protein [Elusimicrobiota bacterium]|nr:aspartate aminotransferase family protein [Elusimicrobiota bacterium]